MNRLVLGLASAVASLAIALTVQAARAAERGAGIARGCEIMFIMMNDGWTGRKTPYSESGCRENIAKMKSSARGSTDVERLQSAHLNCAGSLMGMWNFNHGAQNDRQIWDPDRVPAKTIEDIRKACAMMLTDVDEDTYYDIMNGRRG